MVRNGKIVYAHFCFMEKQDNDACRGFAGDDKLCITEDGKVTYIFGLMSLSNRPDVINEIQFWLRNRGWELGASDIVGKECSTLLEVLERIAFRDALNEFYFEHPVSILDMEGFLWFKTSVVKKYLKKQKNIKAKKVLGAKKISSSIDELIGKLNEMGFSRLEEVAI